jgi:hypothetical protein
LQAVSERSAIQHPEVAWRLNPILDLRIEVLDDRCLVFEATSGETSLAEPLAAAVLACFGTGIHCLDEVARNLSNDLDIPGSPALTAEILEAVTEFVGRGWLESATLAE